MALHVSYLSGSVPTEIAKAIPDRKVVKPDTASPSTVHLTPMLRWKNVGSLPERAERDRVLNPV